MQSASPIQSAAPVQGASSVQGALPARAITGVDGLIRDGLVDAAGRRVLTEVGEAFRIRISPAMQQKGAEGVLAQFLPDARELNILPEELVDPIGDDAHRPVQGLTHRYPDRVILHATQTCEVYCRFCFRREAVGETGQLAEDEFLRVLAYLRDHPQIWEVILTGGDPLTLSRRRLADMLARLSEIPSVQVIRFHTRIPVVAPERITDDLVQAMQIRPAVWLVVHTNHADEITPAAEAAFRRLTRAGVPLLSQTVLLKGVNAEPDLLEQLFRALIRNRVKPYYLHHPDLAKGTGHFRLTIREGQAIMAALRGRISGTALPTYVLDIPGGHGKVPIGPDYLQEEGPGRWLVTDPQGGLHDYRDL
ncbi:lysine-2,3-aminomutase-like protein [Xinfangfangia sp. D13-10-4-6]|uniref:lysine-2,3-aminomutase-like protein n=1 Tax=Pseudogemmobacter hezensis TaxID=2737662 RepID=UPI001557BAC3|nr:lysine-2,3-aminomutase-like protein [Pseudogemmobacter hezensis]NPD15900.1 lysine-2,3-aminomutase-like protein [Pseudogemmobacter hezensis]